MNHDHKGHVHGELIDGKDLDVDPDRYQNFIKDLEDCQIAVVSVIGMVCDFCAQGLEKTFEKDRNVKILVYSCASIFLNNYLGKDLHVSMINLYFC